MSDHIVKIIEANFVTPNVKRFLIQKPTGYSFIPGQATEVAVNIAGWETQFRPFTFTGLNKWDNLELTLRIYKGHNGVTELLGRINAGSELIIKEPFGAIQYKGPGTFIAGGTGITPFVSIFRELYENHQLNGNHLVYSNYTAEDVICGVELHDMLHENYINHYTRQGVIGFRERRLDSNLLIKYISDFGQRFYVCGSENFVTDICKILLELGATSDSLVIEK